MLNRALSTVKKLATSPAYRDLFFYRRWASERQPYKSQHGQDYWVDKMLKRKREGFFLDLAAADGEWISNTWFLEKQRGWKGICIEPNPTMFRKLVSCRTSTCVDRCVSDKVETVQFRVDNGVVGGIVGKDTDNKPEAGGTLMSFDAITLSQLLVELNAPKYIDYFSLDVEGAEDRVIAGLDLSVFRFGLITVERPSAFVEGQFRKHGYQFVKRIEEDSFFADPKLL